MPPLRETIPLQKAKVVKKSIGGTVGVLVFCGMLTAFFVAPFVFPAGDSALDSLQKARVPILVAWLAFVLCLLVWIPVYQYLYFKRYFYDIAGKDIVIAKGVLARKEITLPFSRITDVYVDQDILDAAFGLYDVHISTPTEQSGLFAHIDGVDKEGSQQLRRMILDRLHGEPEPVSEPKETP